MTTARLDAPLAGPPTTEDPAAALPARISFRQPISTSGFIDAAWWPRSTDLAAELPPLLDVLWTAGRAINRITFNSAAWTPAPRRMLIRGRTVRLGGFTTSDPTTVRLTDAWGRERIDIVVIPPTTDPDVAQRALLLAGETHGAYRAAEILARAAGPDAPADVPSATPTASVPA